jgi:hypothetical protein
MITTTIRRAAAGALALSLLVPGFVFAETGVDAALGATAQAQVGTTQVKAQVNASTTLSAAVMTRAKTKAGNEIDRRIKALTDLSTRVTGMTKVTAEFKQNLATNVQNQITALTNLKAKIEADTDGATLKTDIQTITQSYRVFALVIPQARIAAAADREATLINMLAGLGAKLQARLQTAQQAGADVTALATALTDMGNKLASAQTHAQAAITGSATLTPDNGDAAGMKANTDALQAARKEIEAAHQDLIAARKAADTILKGLKTLKVNTTASTTTQTP